MTPGYDRPLYVLPFDHRGSFQSKMFGWKGALSAEQTAEIAAAKRVVYDGFRAALKEGVPADKAGILVDEQFGADILRDAAARGYTTACPAEKSGQDEFDFEYGDDFARHIEAFAPTFCKVLVRYNPEGDRALNRRQADRLRRLSEYLRSRGQSRFMFELLVPPEAAELEEVHGDTSAYDRELRPGLMVRAVRELQDAGVEPDVWKVEGSTAARIVPRSSPRPAGAAGTGSGASSWDGARTRPRSASGWRPRPACRGSSGSPSAARRSGTRWWNCGPGSGHGKPRWPRSAAASGPGSRPSGIHQECPPATLNKAAGRRTRPSPPQPGRFPPESDMTKAATAPPARRASPATRPAGQEIQAYGSVVHAPVALAEAVRRESVSNLNQVLADTIVLRDLYQKHHWQTSGPTFYPLHLLFDKHREGQGELADELAERIMSLGGVCLAMPADVASATLIPSPPQGREPADVQLGRLLHAHEIVLEEARAMARLADKAGDDGTNDLLISGVIRTNEEQAWFVNAHLVDQKPGWPGPGST